MKTALGSNRKIVKRSKLAAPTCGDSLMASGAPSQPELLLCTMIFSPTQSGSPLKGNAAHPHGGAQVVFPGTLFFTLFSLYSRYKPKSFWFGLHSLSSSPTCFVLEGPLQFAEEGVQPTEDTGRRLKARRRKVKVVLSCFLPSPELGAWQQPCSCLQPLLQPSSSQGALVTIPSPVPSAPTGSHAFH